MYCIDINANWGEPHIDDKAMFFPVLYLYTYTYIVPDYASMIEYGAFLRNQTSTSE